MYTHGHTGKQNIVLQLQAINDVAKNGQTDCDCGANSLDELLNTYLGQVEV